MNRQPGSRKLPPLPGPLLPRRRGRIVQRSALASVEGPGQGYRRSSGKLGADFVPRHVINGTHRDLLSRQLMRCFRLG